MNKKIINLFIKTGILIMVFLVGGLAIPSLISSGESIFLILPSVMIIIISGLVTTFIFIRSIVKDILFLMK